MTEQQIQQPQKEPNESTYRIRAAVRVLMSPGMWLAVMLFVLTAIQNPLVTGEKVSPGDSTILFHLFLFAFLFVVSGLFQSLATGNSVVSLRDVILNAPPVFGRFLLLILKALFVFILLPVLLFFTLIADPEAMKTHFWMLSVIYELAILFAIYWLPIAFVTGRFGLVQTMTAALQMQLHRLRQLPFLAVLLLTPNILGMLFQAEQQVVAVILISALSEILGWIAYTYCIEYVVRHRDEAVSAVSR